MGRSWAEEKSFYPLILTIIVMLHAGVLWFKITLAEKKVPDEVNKPLIVKIRPDVNKQIVQSEDSEKDEVKDKAFLSDKNRSFDRQSKARVTDIFKDGRKSEGGARSGAKNLKLSDLGAGPGEDPFKSAAKDYSKMKKGDGGKSPERSVSSTNDYVAEIPPGDLTHLNTVEYKYYGFYHRIRQKLEQFWGRSLYAKAEQLAKSGRRVPSSEELITALQITLSDEGEIISIKVKGSSGIKELDDAAIESFNEAGPFPNPPQDLIVNGKVTLEWGFVVKS